MKTTPNFSTADWRSFQERQTVTIKAKSIGYLPDSFDHYTETGIAVDKNGKKVERTPYKKFKTKSGFGIDLNCLRHGEPWQIVLMGPDIVDAIEHGDFWDDGTEQWVIFPKFKCQTNYIATGRFEVQHLETGPRPQIVIFDPVNFRERTIKERPPRPSEVAKRKAINTANKIKNAKEVTKKKARTGRSVKAAL